MLDPVSAIGLVGSIVGVSDVIAKCVKTLIGLQASYKTSDLFITVLIGQLTTVKAALSQISDWTRSNLSLERQHAQLVLDIKVAVDSCRTIVSTLEGRIDALEQDARHALTTGAKIAFAFEEQGIKDFANLLNHQTSALNLLVSAVHCKSAFEQNSLLQNEESRQIIKQVEDDKSSVLLSSNDSVSIRSRHSRATERSGLSDTDFAFDNQVIDSKAYRAAFQSQLSQNARTRSTRTDRQPGVSNAPASSSSAVLQAVPEATHTSDSFLLEANEKDDAFEEAETSAFSRWLGSAPIVSIEQQVDQYSEKGSVRYAETIGSDSDTTSIHSNMTERPIHRTDSVDTLPIASPLSEKHQQASRRTWQKPKSRSIFSFLAQEKARPGPQAMSASEQAPNTTGKPATNTQPPTVFEARSSKSAKVLLLGSGLSGKTTLHKSMKSYFEPTCSYSERLELVEIIRDNLIVNAEVVLEAMATRGIHIAPRFRQHIYIQDLPTLFSDSDFRSCLNRAVELRIPLDDCASYYFENLDRIIDDYYVPTDEDMLRSRTKTLGMYRTNLNLGGTSFQLFDTGGERVERKKWVHFFEDTDAVIFCVDISAYDRLLREDDAVNQMQEDLTLFDSVCNTKWFTKSHMILLFTKMDLLRDKVPKSSFKRFFPSFDGEEENFVAVKWYIARRFYDLKKDPDKRLTMLFGSFFEGENPTIKVFEALREAFGVHFDIEAHQNETS